MFRQSNIWWCFGETYHKNLLLIRVIFSKKIMLSFNSIDYHKVNWLHIENIRFVFFLMEYTEPVTSHSYSKIIWSLPNVLLVTYFAC